MFEVGSTVLSSSLNKIGRVVSIVKDDTGETWYLISGSDFDCKQESDLISVVDLFE